MFFNMLIISIFSGIHSEKIEIINYLIILTKINEYKNINNGNS